MPDISVEYTTLLLRATSIPRSSDRVERAAKQLGEHPQDLEFLQGWTTAELLLQNLLRLTLLLPVPQREHMIILLKELATSNDRVSLYFLDERALRRYVWQRIDPEISLALNAWVESDRMNQDTSDELNVQNLRRALKKLGEL